MLDVEDLETVAVRQEDGVTTITLNRPKLLNATNMTMERELCRVLTDVNHDRDTRVVVLTGAGTAFSGGGDFEYIRQGLEQPEVFQDGIAYAKRLVFSMLECGKPIVGRINGHAIGLGATLALFCDVTFAVEHAKIADPHVAIGFVAGDGGAIIWPQLIGYNRAKEYLFTGEPIVATEAEKMGLINHAVAPAELDERVNAYVAKLLQMPPRALQWTKASVNIGLKQLAHSIMDASIAYEALSNSTQEHRDAFEAVERRVKKLERE